MSQLPIISEGGYPGRAPSQASAPELLRPPLLDKQGRTISYLRLSVTDRCNFRCTYCSPAVWGGSSELLTRQEIARLVGIFARMGVSRVRLTGGEPLYRKDLTEIAAAIGATPGIRQVALTTNGYFLARAAAGLREAGVTQLNVSVDSLDPATFGRLSGGGSLDEVLRGVEAAVASGFPAIKLNTVVVRGVNEHEVVPLARWAWARGIVPRYIECMPFRDGEPVATDDLLRRFAEEGEPLTAEGLADDGPRGPAAYYRSSGGGHAGFIGSMTQNFCGACNRVRVGPAGALRACLGGRDEVPLAPLLRAAAPDEAIAAVIRGALEQKPDGHRFTEGGAREQLLTMMGIGG